MPNRKQADQICADLALKHKLEGVPGFYNKDGAWHMTTPAFYHLIVPVRDINGRIQGFQLRLGNEVKAVKRLSVSLLDTTFLYPNIISLSRAMASKSLLAACAGLYM